MTKMKDSEKLTHKRTGAGTEACKVFCYLAANWYEFGAAETGAFLCVTAAAVSISAQKGAMALETMDKRRRMGRNT